MKKKKVKKIGFDCSCCDWFQPLWGKELQSDFGFCTRLDCEVYYQVLFEHFKCKKVKEDEKET